MPPNPGRGVTPAPPVLPRHKRSDRYRVSPLTSPRHASMVPRWVDVFYPDGHSARFKIRRRKGKHYISIPYRYSRPSPPLEATGWFRNSVPGHSFGMVPVGGALVWNTSQGRLGREAIFGRQIGAPDPFDHPHHISNVTGVPGGLRGITYTGRFTMTTPGRHNLAWWYNWFRQNPQTPRISAYGQDLGVVPLLPMLALIGGGTISGAWLGGKAAEAGGTEPQMWRLFGGAIGAAIGWKAPEWYYERVEREATGILIDKATSLADTSLTAASDVAASLAGAAAGVGRASYGATAPSFLSSHQQGLAEQRLAGQMMPPETPTASSGPSTNLILLYTGIGALAGNFLMRGSPLAIGGGGIAGYFVAHAQRKMEVQKAQEATEAARGSAVPLTTWSCPPGQVPMGFGTGECVPAAQSGPITGGVVHPPPAPSISPECQRCRDQFPTTQFAMASSQSPAGLAPGEIATWEKCRDQQCFPSFSNLFTPIIGQVI